MYGLDFIINERSMLNQFIKNGYIGIDCKPEEYDEIFLDFREIGVGDIVYLKSHKTRSGLSLHAVGIKTEERLVSLGMIDKMLLTVKVDWRWHTATYPLDIKPIRPLIIGKLGEKDDVRKTSKIYKEKHPELCRLCMYLLLEGEISAHKISKFLNKMKGVA